MNAAKRGAHDLLQGEQPKREVILQLKNITKIYPGTVALQKVNLEVMRGEVHGIIGKNGAGKSTLVGIISGMVASSGGEILIKGRKLAHLSRLDAKRERIAIVPQEPQVISDFTVAENLFLGDYPHQGPLVNWPEMFRRAEDILRRTGLNINARAKAGELSISEQQLLLLAKACGVEQADIIILDEASASLSHDDESVFFSLLGEQKRMGKTIILISHRTDEILKVCNRVTVIRDGRSVKTISCEGLDRQQLSALIVGDESGREQHVMAGSSRAQAGGEVVLKVEGFTRAGCFENVHFALKKGEVVGLAGLRGSGRTELFKSIVGIDPHDAGTLEIAGCKCTVASPSQALERGIVYLPEDREKEGLVAGLSVRENLVLNSLAQISKATLIDRKKEDSLVSRLIKTLGIVTAAPAQEVGQLSGGNKQKVVVGRISAFGPLVYLLDEPTRGIDIATKDSILRTIREKLAAQAGVVITSPGLDDLLLICDRILVLYKGRIVAGFERAEFNEGQIFMAMQGELAQSSHTGATAN
ncbi:MAG: sugar ABC transporter ATP-binding protein [Peptococcaceae bacterium]|jgi:ABC-type sugar transport system ATPase subunit|nr:sugar ABC transporter ATP-binding protein [Peptococcaceae bacterium]